MGVANSETSRDFCGHGAVEKNLSTVKSVMQDRIGETEDRLGRLRTWQEELAAKQEEFQTGIQEELVRLKATVKSTAKPMGESESAWSKYSMRPTAPIFVPSAGSSAMATGGGADGDGSGSKPVQQPAPYDGKSAWEAYRTQFSLLAELNNWTEQQRAAYLAISLRGSALTVLTLSLIHISGPRDATLSRMPSSA